MSLGMILLYKLWESLRRIGTDCLLNVWWKWKLVSRVQFFGNPWTVVHGILQARILEWVAFPFSRGSSQPRDPTHVSCIAGEFFTSWATSSVQFSCSVVSDSLRPHGPQHTRPPCPSPTPGVYPNPCPSSLWCHPTISPSVIPFSSCPQSFPASGSFQMSQLFPSCGQSIGVSALASVLPMNTQDWSPLGWATREAVKCLVGFTNEAIWSWAFL